jgi:uncharacterized membrane protein
MTWAHPIDGRLLVALVLTLAGLLVLASRLAVAASARGSLLILLRAASVSLVVMILLGPVRVETVRRPLAPPAMLFLFDASRSMSLETPVTRSQAAQELVRRALFLVPPERMPRIQSYRFGRSLGAISDAGLVTLPRPDDEETRLVASLKELPSRFDDGSPAGVFVFSDGRVTEPEGTELLAHLYRAWGVPIHVIPLGDQQASGDVAVRMIDAPRDAAPGTKVPVRVSLRSRGYDGERVELRIHPADAPQARPIASLPITLTGGEQSHELIVETDQARGPLVAEVPVHAHEAISSNNLITFQIAPKPRKIRAIYMEGGPPNGYRRLSEALAEDPDIECLDIGTTYRGARGGGLARKNDPGHGYPASRAELFEYDVVICSDILRTSFSSDQLNWTVELVGQRGGGFAMVGGNNSYGAGQYHTTVWNGLIPVDMGQWGLDRGFANIIYWGQGKIFRVVVPAEAQSHAIWHFADDANRNRAILDKMPIFYGCNLVERLKPGATVLGNSDRPLLNVGKAPIFSCQNFGRGRTFAMLTDTTPDWGVDFEKSWGEQGDNRYFRRFWRNVVRWLGENSAGSDRRVRVDIDKLIYQPGQPILISVLAFDEQARAVDTYRVQARLRALDQTAGPQPDGPARGARDTARLVELQSATLMPETKDHTFRGQLTAPAAGTIVVEPGSTVQNLILDIEVFDGERKVAQARRDLQLLDDPAEFLDPRPDGDLLVRLAGATGGRVLRSPEALVDVLTRQHTPFQQTFTYQQPLWDNPLIWALILALLATEWIVRRSRGLA